MGSKVPVINMLKTDLDNINDVPLPEGYSLRLYKEGDRDVWAELYDSIDDFLQITPQTFNSSFGDDHSLLSQSMMFLCFDGLEIGTVTAWPEPEIDKEKTSRLHWIGVSKDHRGKHLGAALTSYILKHMRDRGCKKCVLGTSEKRIEALNMYFDFGFFPYVYTDRYSPMDAQREAWGRVKEKIKDDYRNRISF